MSLRLPALVDCLIALRIIPPAAVAQLDGSPGYPCRPDLAPDGLGCFIEPSLDPIFLLKFPFG